MSAESSDDRNSTSYPKKEEKKRRKRKKEHSSCQYNTIGHRQLLGPAIIANGWMLLRIDCPCSWYSQLTLARLDKLCLLVGLQLPGSDLGLPDFLSLCTLCSSFFLLGWLLFLRCIQRFHAFLHPSTQRGDTTQTSAQPETTMCRSTSRSEDCTRGLRGVPRFVL